MQACRRLRADSRLMQAAQLHADQMARLGRLEHVLSGAQYPRPEDRLAAAGYQWSAYAENIAMGQSSAAAAMDSWMHSSGHRANILTRPDGDRDRLRARFRRPARTTFRSSVSHAEQGPKPVSGIH